MDAWVHTRSRARRPPTRSQEMRSWRWMKWRKNRRAGEEAEEEPGGLIPTGRAGLRDLLVLL